MTAAIPLHSHLSIEGMAPGTYPVSPTQPPVIRLQGDGPGISIFKIGPDTRQIAIRDLALIYDNSFSTASNAAGILAQDTTTASQSSQGFEFTNLRFDRFQYGILVKSVFSPAPDGSGSWQFDNAHIENSTFDSCKYGIYLDAANIGWQMNTLMFSSKSGQEGVHIEKAGYISMDFLVGNADKVSGQPAAENFIYIKRHATIDIQNTSAEWYKYQLNIDGVQDNKQYPITLINNGFPSCPKNSVIADSTVRIANASVTSHGNWYGCPGEVARPRIEGLADVYSTGDKFCLDYAAQCYEGSLRSEFAVLSNTAVLRSDNLFDIGPTDVDWIKPITEISTSWCCSGNLETNSPPAGFKPLLALTNILYTGGVTYRYSYNFTRNARSGRLELKGSESPNKTGYHFKGGPVQLQKVTQTDLSSYNSSSASLDPDSGSMLYCSNCVAGSTPCATGGGGALALKVESGAWHCK